MPITITLALYCTAWLVLVQLTRKKRLQQGKLPLILVAAALCFHGFTTYNQIVMPAGYHFSFFKISSLFFLVANVLVLLSSIRLPLHNLFLVTLPLSIVTLFTTLFVGHAEITPLSDLSSGVVGHIFLSIVAYSTMIIATVQALLLAFQNHQIRNKHPAGLARLLPPLQTMESLLFEMLWVGEILLTLVMITGIAHINNVAAQHLHHKIAFTAIAWVIYGILLWGRHFLGWRGNIAIRWALAGFASLILAYWGTKLVFEFLLTR